MLPKCAWQGFYVYFDNDSKKCICYKWYERKNWERSCSKK